MTRATRLKTVLVGIGVTGAAVATIALAGPSLASAADPSADPSTSTSASGPSQDRAADRAKNQDELATALAAELGVDKDKVAAALAKIQSERAANRPARPEGATPASGADASSRLDAAVAAGTITQAEADAVKKAMEAGVLRGPHGGPPK